jgi:hypothetical protein
MKIDTIYLDLDDVCNVLTPYLLWWLNCPVEPTDYSPYPGKMDIVPAANRLLGAKRYTRKTFWEAIPRRAWAECPESPFFGQLLRACKRIADQSIYIATSPTKDPDCLAGKLEWIHAHLPRWMHRQYFITPRKHLLARPRALLIDDNESNCRLFEAAGGRAIRVPRPWNDVASHEPWPYLAAQFDQIARESQAG